MASGWLLAAPSPGSALELALRETVDVGGPFISLDASPAALAFDDATGHLWVAESANGGAVFEMDPASGLFLSTLDPADSLGMEGGADAIAVDPDNGNLVLMSIFGENVGGVVTQSNQVVFQYLSGTGGGGAGFSPDGELWVAYHSETIVVQVHVSSGFILNQTDVPGSGSFHAADFDPVTGNFVAYEGTTDRLFEVDTATGAILDSTYIVPVLGSFGAGNEGIAFDADGDTLYYIHSSEPDSLYVMDVVPEPATALLLAGGLGALARWRTAARRPRRES